MKIHKRVSEKMKLPAKLEAGDIIPYASSVNSTDLIRKLSETGYVAHWLPYNLAPKGIKAFGFVVIKNRM